MCWLVIEKKNDRVLFHTQIYSCHLYIGYMFLFRCGGEEGLL